MNRKLRTALAFLVAPAWIPALGVGTIYFVDPYAAQDNSFPLIGATSAMVTYLGVLVIGLPAFLFLRRRGWTSRWLAVALGFGAGVVMCAAFLFVFGLGFGEGLSEQLAMLRQEPVLPNIIMQLVTGSLGALVGITLWLIARPDRP